MQRIIVCDTSCLILFNKIGQFELLEKVFGQITITKTVLDEFKKPIPKWVRIENPKSNLHRGLMGFVDAGEATSISLAIDYNSSLLIIDELKGRRLAKELGIEVTGSLGVLVAAKSKGHIKLVMPILEKIKSTNFRLSDELIQKVLIGANEA